MQIKDSNIASYPRPNEYQGTIAIDHLHQAGTKISDLLEPAIAVHREAGYYLAGFKISTGHPSDVIRTNQLSVRILIKSGIEFRYVDTTVNAVDFFRAITNLRIQVCAKQDFESDSVDWGNIQMAEVRSL